MTEDGKKILKDATLQVRKQLNQVTNIISDEEIIYLNKIMDKFRNGLKKEVEMKI